MQLTAPFRPATPDDAQALIEFADYASEGLALYLWTKTAEPGQDPRGRRPGAGVARDRQLFLPQCHHDGTGGTGRGRLDRLSAAGSAEPIPDTVPPMFVPLQELENLAPGTWYVNVLAAYPEHRGRGRGTALLAVADRVAAANASKGLSIIVSDSNTGARCLYERSGYREMGRRAKIKEGWQNPGTEWVLLTKSSLQSR